MFRPRNHFNNVGLVLPIDGVSAMFSICRVYSDFFVGGPMTSHGVQATARFTWAREAAGFASASFMPARVTLCCTDSVLLATFGINPKLEDEPNSSSAQGKVESTGYFSNLGLMSLLPHLSPFMTRHSRKAGFESFEAQSLHATGESAMVRYGLRMTLLPPMTFCM